MSKIDHHSPIVESKPHCLAQAQLLWPNEDAARAFAQRLAASQAIDHAFISLHGDLGAGKTTLARHLLQALGVRGRIKSPTYAILESYAIADGPHAGLAVAHFDFYRLSDPREWLDAGFREVFEQPGLKLAEWPEHAGPLLPPADLQLHLHIHPNEERLVHAWAMSQRGLALLQASMDSGCISTLQPTPSP